jgi:hypothetical protein
VPEMRARTPMQVSARRRNRGDPLVSVRTGPVKLSIEAQALGRTNPSSFRAWRPEHSQNERPRSLRSFSVPISQEFRSSVARRGRHA